MVCVAVRAVDMELGFWRGTGAGSAALSIRMSKRRGRVFICTSGRKPVTCSC